MVYLPLNQRNLVLLLLKENIVKAWFEVFHHITVSEEALEVAYYNYHDIHVPQMYII